MRTARRAKNPLWWTRARAETILRGHITYGFRPAIFAMNHVSASVPTVVSEKTNGTIRRVIFASSLGTLFEWYDFYLYGSLAVFFGELFFPPGSWLAVCCQPSLTCRSTWPLRRWPTPPWRPS
jgi:hypothetical protein